MLAQGIQLSLLIGPVVPVPVPRAVLDALESVEVSTRTGGASATAGLPSSATTLEPARVTSPATSNRSLIETMAPSIGPSDTPALARASAASAAARAASR